jgi:hypothetical protein
MHVDRKYTCWCFVCWGSTPKWPWHFDAFCMLISAKVTMAFAGRPEPLAGTSSDSRARGLTFLDNLMTLKSRALKGVYSDHVSLAGDLWTAVRHKHVMLVACNRVPWNICHLSHLMPWCAGPCSLTCLAVHLHSFREIAPSPQRPCDSVHVTQR